MARRCDLTGKRPNSANNVSHSHIKTKKKQKPQSSNSSDLEEGDTFVKLVVYKGIENAPQEEPATTLAKEAGIDLRTSTPSEFQKTRRACSSC